jgi:hypothetical protein
MWRRLGLTNPVIRIYFCATLHLFVHYCTLLVDIKFVFIVWMIMPVSLINHNYGALFNFLECLSQNILALLYEKDGNYHCCALSYDIAISTPKKNERETKT